MRVIPALLAIASLARFAAASEPFSFAGFHRDMDLASLLDRYPKSEHDVSLRVSSHRTSQDNLRLIGNSFAIAASGTYTLRLTLGNRTPCVLSVQGGTT